MGSALPVILALTLAAEPPPADAPTRPAVKVVAIAGVALVGVGLGFEMTGRVANDPRAPVREWQTHAQANTVGGIALMGAGLCLITIAALLTHWPLPSVALSVTPNSALLAFGAQWP